MSGWVEKKTLTGGGVRYRARFRDSEGKVHEIGSFPLRREAKAALGEVETKVRRGRWIDPARGQRTFGDYFLNDWLPNRIVEHNTRQGYLSAWNASVEAEWGDTQLRAITPSGVQGWIDRMVSEGVHAGTVLKRYRLLRLVLAAQKGASAMSDRLIEFNPCERILLPTETKPAVSVHSPDEFLRLVAEIEDSELKELVIFQCETGLRWGELMGIQLDKFSVGRRKLLVARTIVQSTHSAAFAATGTASRFMWKQAPKGKRQRSIDVTPTARDIVEAIVVRHNLRGDDRLFSKRDSNGRVVRTAEFPEGLPLAREWWREQIWYPAVERAGVPRLRPHTVRAANLSWMLASGLVDPNTVREHAGHASLLTTQRYFGAMPDRADRISQALEATKAQYPVLDWSVATSPAGLLPSAT